MASSFLRCCFRYVLTINHTKRRVGIHARTHTLTNLSLSLSLSLSLFFQYAPTKTILEAMFQAGLSAPKVDATEAEEGQTETLTERWFGTLMKLQGLVSS